MTAPANSDDPKATATYRAMKAVVIILGVLIVLALAAIVVGGVRLFAKHTHADAASIAVLPPGAKITTIETNSNRLILGLHTGGGDEVEIVDTDTGRLVARIKAAPPDVPK